VAIILGAIIAGVAVWELKPVEPRQITRLYYEPPKDQQFGTSYYDRALAVSPDGRQFVYSASTGLYLRSMDELEAKLIPGTAGNPELPCFSPDGKWVGYWSRADNQLKKIAISGGSPVAIADALPSGYLSWGANDTIVFGQAGKLNPDSLRIKSWNIGVIQRAYYIVGANMAKTIDELRTVYRVAISQSPQEAGFCSVSSVREQHHYR
jgi:hypothetical protein